MNFKLAFGAVFCCVVAIQEVHNAVVFKSDLSKGSLAAIFAPCKVSYGNDNVKISGGELIATYPKGTYVPSVKPQGGFGVWTNHKVNGNTAVFKYSVFFPSGFNFVKGGKLPGLYGGKTSCSGGNPAEDCFSTRLMWRADGKGEIYLYANRPAQDPAICKLPDSECNEVYGWSLGRGKYSFKRNAWTNVEETIKLNTPGKRDGVLSLKINGERVIHFDNIVFRTSKYPNIKIEGMDVETFFGGSNPSYASPSDQTAKFKNFVLESN